MILIQDQIGNELNVQALPTRIISLVPSITEYLHDLGLGERVVGITKFCIHPDKWRREKVVVGGTKQQHLQTVNELNPDLIIASKEENVKSYVEALAHKYPVYVSDVKDMDTALQMMTDIGELLGKSQEAKEIASQIEGEFAAFSKVVPTQQVAYCIWKKPWMWAGTDTFISNMLEHCGFKNTIEVDRYPEVNMDQIVQKEPDYVFLSSEPYPFQEKHLQELNANYPHTRFVIVDGEMFSWYGSRMLKAPAYFKSLLGNIKSE